MEPDTIATPEEKIYKLYLPEALQDGVPPMKTARTTVDALEINCDVRMENPSTGMKLLLLSSLCN
jgi:hypothetical protein